MQLFITNNFQITWDKVEINDERVFYQCTKVLRYKIGAHITLQSETKRYIVALESRDKNSISWSVVWTEQQHKSEFASDNCIIVGMVNKRDKIELIAQKAAEIGIDTIGIRISKRSVIQVISDNKLERLKSICLEAAEQSRNWHVPELKVYQKIEELPRWFVASQGPSISTSPPTPSPKRSFRSAPVTRRGDQRDSIIVWPEWGFDPSEIDYFQNNWFEFVQLGTTILRTETAAIVGSWWLKNTI